MAAERRGEGPQQRAFLLEDFGNAPAALLRVETPGQLPATLFQPGVEFGETGKRQARREQPLPDVARLVFHLALLPARGGGAGDGLDQVTVRQGPEAAVELPLLAGEDRRDNRLGVVADTGQRHPAETREGPVVGLEDHLCVSRGKAATNMRRL